MGQSACLIKISGPVRAAAARPAGSADSDRNKSPTSGKTTSRHTDDLLMIRIDSVE